MPYVGDECECCATLLDRPATGPIPVLCPFCLAECADCDLCQRAPATHGALCGRCADAVTLAESELGELDQDTDCGWTWGGFGALLTVVVVALVCYAVIWWGPA